MAASVSMPLAQAAQALQVSTSTLRRWIAKGAPTVRPGRSGRGGAALYDPAAVRAWRAAGAFPRAEPSDQALDFRAELIGLRDLVMTTIAERFAKVEGPHKRQIASEFATLGYLLLFEIEDRYDLPVIEIEALERLRQIASL